MAAAATTLEQPWLVDADEAARLCGMSRSTWYELVAAGKAPARVRLPFRAGRWDRRELLAWVGAGCPDRRGWEAIKGARR
jgi:predicted DNA-binding transcriptional regulator AlpA